MILATRIVDLTWRLQRAAQDRNETFGALYDRQTAGPLELAGPAERQTMLGRMILEDYEQGGVLERWLRYERRIKGSLFRNLNEMCETNPIPGEPNADESEASPTRRGREAQTDSAEQSLFAAKSLPCEGLGHEGTAEEGEERTSRPWS